jgi:putative ABC transport system permease protein
VRPAYQAIVRLQLAGGRFLSTIDDSGGTEVCVLGSELARRLFRYADPVGQFIRVRDDYFKVVGVLAQHGASLAAGAMAWRDLNNTVLVPLAALSKQGLHVAPGQPVSEIWLQTGNVDQVEAIGRLLRTTLERLHNGRPDVDVIVPRELLAQRYRTQQTFSVVVGSIAVIALLIGGIGIMNIMLTSVIERTHEIGIRRTVGATRQHVTIQFLTESLLMTLSGGVMGIVVGVGIALGITSYAGWATHVSVLALLLAVSVSLAVGLIFGIYPAVKAANLQPVDAVRYE